MNFLADESIDRQIVERLRADGHSVQSVAEMEPGISDDVVLGLANRVSALLLTADCRAWPCSDSPSVCWDRPLMLFSKRAHAIQREDRPNPS